jgi:hypothetical protein
LKALHVAQGNGIVMYYAEIVSLRFFAAVAVESELSLEILPLEPKFINAYKICRPCYCQAARFWPENEESKMGDTRSPSQVVPNARRIQIAVCCKMMAHSSRLRFITKASRRHACRDEQ